MDGNSTTSFPMLRRNFVLSRHQGYLLIGFGGYSIIRLFGLSNRSNISDIATYGPIAGAMQRMQGLNGSRVLSWRIKLTPRNNKLREIRQRRQDTQPGSKILSWEAYKAKKLVKKKPKGRR